jgi:hypothetical protein
MSFSSKICLSPRTQKRAFYLVGVPSGARLMRRTHVESMMGSFTEDFETKWKVPLFINSSISLSIAASQGCCSVGVSRR